MQTIPTASPIDAQFQSVTEMVHCYAESVGLNRSQVYNPDRKNWTWNKGSAAIEIFIQRSTLENGYQRDFLKIFSPLMEVPQTNRIIEFYHRLLELNDEKLGIKISLQKGSKTVWATFERDIKGMDYNELVTFITDFEFWADHLDDELKDEFPMLN